MRYCCYFFIEDSGVQEATIARSAGQPGLVSSLAIDRICRKSIRTRRYLAVAFMTLIAAQMISYILLCAGIDLFFRRFVPFSENAL